MNTQNSKASQTRRGWQWLFCLPVLAGALIAATPSTQAQTEEGIKAAFIYNFAKFVEWPAAVYANASAPLSVGFVGGNALADLFEQNIKGKNANGREFVVKRISESGSAETCQIIYIADLSQTAAVTAVLKGKPVLVIGDAESVLESGGTIRFIKDGAKVVFDLNLASATAVGLKVDPKIQKAARNVKGG